MFTRVRISLLLLVVLVAAMPLFAQTSSTTGEIAGTVTDNTGGALPGVTVTATNVETGLTRNTVTENDGRYNLSLLPPGKYRVNAELAGLGNVKRDSVTVLLGTTTKTDLKINPQVSQEITVTAAAPIVDTTQSGITQSVTEKQIENLPILTRDFTSLAQLTPGINTTFNAGITANGGRGITANFNIDGANSNSEFFGQVTGGTRAPFTFSQAAIREFQVIRSQYNAEYGRGVGATLNAITKSGTNNVDGEVFTFLRKKSWASTRPATINGQPSSESFRAKDSMQPGFAVGGPIVRDKVFYFVNADLQRQKLPIVATDFTTRPEFIALSPDVKSAFFAKYESLVGYPYAKELNYDQTYNQNTYLAKVDANVGMKNHFSLRDNYSDFHNENNQSGFQVLSGQGDEHDKFNQLVGQGETIFSQNLYNQAILEFETQERPINPTSQGFPEIQVRQGSGTLTFGNINFLPNNTEEKKYQLKDTLSYSLGSHTIKGGVEGLWQHYSNLFPRYSRGQYQFASVADFLANKPSRFQQGMGPEPASKYSQNTYGIFLQDSFKPMSHLNLDLGVRYETQTMPDAQPVGAAAKYPEFKNSWKDSRDAVAPRFGFAYDILNNGRSVLRGGTGYFFNFLPAILLANPLSQTNGWFNQINLDCTKVTCPAFPTLLTPAQFAGQPPASTAFQTIESNLAPQKAWRSSLQFEQQIARQYSVGIGGEYAQLTDVQGKQQLNAMPTGYSFGNLPVYNLTNPNRPYPEYGSVLADFSGEKAWYRAYTVETHKLALEGSKVSWDLHYTWSKAVDQESNERSTSSTFLYDPFNPSLSQGPSDYDVRHRIVGDLTYQLPFGIFVSGIYRWSSGAPYTAGANCNCGGASLNGLINVTGDIPVFVDSSNNIIDLTGGVGMTRPAFAAWLNGQGAHIIGRNSERQPDTQSMDLRLSKRFGISHGMQLELIGEVFNALNQKNTFVTSTNQRMFTLTYTSSSDKFTKIEKNALFGTPTSYNSAVDPRQFQVAAKIIF